MDSMSDRVTREQVEQAIWQLTGYSGDQVAVDGLLAVVDAYKLSEAGSDDTAHLLLTMVTQILDTGGRMRLVTGEQPVPLTAADIPVIAAAAADQLAERRAERAERAERVRAERAQEEILAPPAGEARCRECGEFKPLTREYWHADRSKATGFRSICITCRQSHRAA
jgi:hypothetical protein